ncbi:unnamed protein product [Aphanomyces euteiches]
MTIDNELFGDFCLQEVDTPHIGLAGDIGYVLPQTEELGRVEVESNAHDVHEEELVHRVVQFFELLAEDRNGFPNEHVLHVTRGNGHDDVADARFVELNELQ